MQDNPYSLYPYHQENSSSQRSDDNSVPSTVIRSTVSQCIDYFRTTPLPDDFISTRAPAGPHQWSSAVVPVVGNDNSSLTDFSDAVESSRCAAHAPPPHQTALDSTLHVPPPTCPSHYSIDTHPRPWFSTAEADNTRAYAPPTWSNVASMQPNRSQVPSGTTDPNIFGRTWSHRSDDHHAVEAPAQPPFLRQTDYPSYQVPTRLLLPFHEAGASYRSTSQNPTTSFGGISSWMPQSKLIQAPSPSHHRRHARRAPAHPDRVTCDKCQKSMRPQSLKRHVREVHDHIKRYTRREFAAEP